VQQTQTLAAQSQQKEAITAANLVQVTSHT
jgi:hypothetical protein